jgi:hypothetical protein
MVILCQKYVQNAIVVGEKCIMRSIIKMIMSRRMRWAGHVARMGEKRKHTGYWWESQKERDHWEDQGVGGWTILKWILGWDGLD